jgi:ABC-type nickel/cobalt efflux system permease component RcnA
MNLEDHKKVCEERYMKKPNLFSVVSSLILIFLAAWTIVSAFANNSERIRASEKDIEYINKKIVSFESIDCKLDTILNRIKP